jgi:hypothetical protein
VKAWLLLAALAALIVAPALGQAPFSGAIERPLQYPCLNQQGKAAPCQFTDIPAPDVAGPFVAPGADKKAQVVTISPNSGASNPYPTNAIPTVAIGAGSTGAVTATMPAAAGRTTWLCGVTISALGGTATVGPVTISNLIGNITFTLQLAATASGNFFSQGFSPCIPAKAVNTSIAIVTTADGTATAVDVNAWGYQQ